MPIVVIVSKEVSLFLENISTEDCNSRLFKGANNLQGVLACPGHLLYAEVVQGNGPLREMARDLRWKAHAVFYSTEANGDFINKRRIASDGDS